MSMRLEYGPVLREKEIAKLQSRLEAAEGALCEIEDIMPLKVTLPLTVSIKSIVDDWRKVKESK